jgi:hypothetical protein
MQPYEIRQFRDGTIDYNNYHARPVRLLTPAMRRLFSNMPALTTALVAIAAIAAITVASASNHRSDRPSGVCVKSY